MAQTIDPQTAQQWLNEKSAVLLDIRAKADFDAGHIDGARNLNAQNSNEIIDSLDKVNDTVIVCCYHGISSINAVNQLTELGFERCFSVQGGMAAWPH